MINWISITERHPELDKIVLCCYMVWIEGISLKKIVFLGYMKESSEGFYWKISATSGEDYVSTITHWAYINLPNRTILLKESEVKERKFIKPHNRVDIMDLDEE